MIAQLQRRRLFPAIETGTCAELVNLISANFVPLAAGAKLDGASVYQALEQQKCDGTAGVPTVFLNLLEYMAAEKKRLSHLKLMTVGGAACPPRIIENFMRYNIWLTGVKKCGSMGCRHPV